jgi:hypothetical protein
MKTYHAIGKLIILTVSLLLLSQARAAQVLTPCFLKVSIYTDIPGIVVDDLVLDPSYPDNPSEIRYITSLNTRDAIPTNDLEEYGSRIEGFITPTESGSYHFFLSSDDGAELHLSSDDSESNARLIAEETDCCDPFQEPETDDFATSLPVTLQAGQSYFIMVLHKEGGGGDFAQVAWRKADDDTPADELSPIPGAFLSTLVDDSDDPSVSITQQPSNSEGIENGSATFEVSFTASPAAPVCVQWQKDGVNIPGAIGSPVTLDLLSLGDNGAKISAIVAVPGAFVVSDQATLNITPDTTAPELTSAKGVPSQPQVALNFSERMDPATATNTSNYQISGPSGALQVTEAQLSASGDQVILITADQVVGTEYTLTLNNITDLAASSNSLAADTTASFFSLGKLLQGPDGFIVWEAEEYDRNLDERWIEVKNREGAAGGVAMLIPNGAGGNETDTNLEYDIVFTKTGTHIIWYRAGADSGSDDSAWLHLNGERPSNRTEGNQASMSGFNGSIWEWNSDPQDGASPMSFEITEVGVHTIGVARREDGAFFDKFVITVDPNFDPDVFGDFGPAVTLREGEPIPEGAKAEITLNPEDSEGIENTSLTLTAGFEVPEGALASAQWQRQDGNDFIDIAGETLSSLTFDPLTMDWNGAVVRFQVSLSGNAVSTEEATITVIPETESPELLSASSVAVSRRVTLLFSEPVTEATATDTSNYAISRPNGSLAVNQATLLPNGLTVLLETGAQSVGTKYTVTVNGVNDTAATANTVIDGQAKFYSLGSLLPQSSKGLMVFEAENYTANLDELWMEDSLRGTPSGGVSMVNPNGAGGSEGATKLEYDLEFTQTGTHIIWYRASSVSGTDDSSWLHFDGERPADRVDGNQASMTGFSGQADFIWLSDPQSGPSPMTFEVGSTGAHTIGLARREDGAFFDKFVITTDPNFDPNDFGDFGPPETREGAPTLPTIALTGPANGAELATGESVQFTVDISNTPRVISKVVYLDNNVVIGEATEAPFGFLWENVPDGAYLIRAQLTDDVGVTVGTGITSILVGSPNDVVMIVGDPDLSNAPADQAVADRLTALGFNVNVVDDNLSQSLNAFGKKLVVISSTVSSGSVGTKFRDVEIPVLLWEQANQDDFGMTTNEDGVTRGGTDPDQTELNVVGSGNALSAGLTDGVHVVATTPTAFTWGSPNENAIIGATIAGDASLAALYGYEAGDEMIDGFIAPGRRAMAFLTDDAYTALNDTGRQLFDAALSWALGSTLPTPEPGGSLSVRIEATAAEQLTLAWEGGNGPFTVQRTDNLSGAAWTDVTTTGDRSATVEASGGVGFFRVVGQ